MSWEADIEELRRREALARQMGGAEKVRRQHDAGRLTVRERIDGLLDAGSFHEIGAIAGRGKYGANGALEVLQPANFVFGRGRIDGRPVVVGGDDFTVRGGAADAAIWQKQVMSEQMANELRIPIIRLVDGTGGGGSVKTIETNGYTYVPANPGWNWVVDNMGTVPVVALGLGSVAGLGAARLASSHYSLMVEGISHMFIAGPPVVARAGQTVTKDELGGSDIHARAGAVDDVVASEADAFAQARRFLSYLPSSVYELPPRSEPNDDVRRDDPVRRDSWLIEAVPRDRRKVYDMRRILRSVVDTDSLFEIGRKYGGSVITALARLDGWPVAVLASDPYFYGGGWTADSSQKAARFIDLANTFHLPVVHLVDVPGFVIGPEAEKAGTIRHGARALAAIYQAKVPWCSVIIRKVFGVAGAGHTPHTRLHYRYAWPSGDWGSLPVEGGIEAAYRGELDAAPDREQLRHAIEERLNR
jgi:acetyl-CoA carboxylase carboxyltransferase component